MGKPATTYFCENGHLLEDNAHHEYGPRDIYDEACMYANYEEPPYTPKKPADIDGCPFCGSKVELIVCEWHDPDYWQNGEPEVLEDPIRQDEIKCVDHKGNEFFRLIDVYDVSKLLWRLDRDNYNKQYGE
jgi:hypothetical protein